LTLGRLKEVENMEEQSQMRALVSDIQRFSIHDGPGIRTTVFFKGCPLRCIWCQNPETLRFENELVFTAEKCIACGECAKICPNQAIKWEKRPVLNWKLCKACFSCVDACPSCAREPAGKEYSPEALAREVLKDREFFLPDGGATLSGGEPFSQTRFLLEFLPLLRKEKIHVTVETCGHFNFDTARPALEMIDLVLFDFKALSPGLHQKLTGKDNALILKNLRNIVELKIPHQVRMPIVPGLNDTEEELAAMAQFLREDLKEPELWLIPYHRLGESKLKKINTELKPLGLASMSEQDLRAKAECLASKGITVRTFVFSIAPPNR